MDHSIRPLTDDEVKRRQPSDDDLTVADRQNNTDKTDPQAIARREHKDLSEQVQMMAILRRTVG